jgi:hypothetical protein
MFGRTRKGRVADPSKACHICHTSSTSLWRKADIEGESVTGEALSFEFLYIVVLISDIVCNACGIKWKTNTSRASETAPPTPLPAPQQNPSQPPPKRSKLESSPSTHGTPAVASPYLVGQAGFGTNAGFTSAAPSQDIEMRT